LRPTDAPLYLRRGRALLRLGRYGAAAASYARGLLRYPRLDDWPADTEPYRQLGEAHARRGDFGRAADALARPFRSEPRVLPNWQNLLFAQLGAGRLGDWRQTGTRLLDHWEPRMSDGLIGKFAYICLLSTPADPARTLRLIEPSAKLNPPD